MVHGSGEVGIGKCDPAKRGSAQGLARGRAGHPCQRKILAGGSGRRGPSGLEMPAMSRCASKPALANMAVNCSRLRVFAYDAVASELVFSGEEFRRSRGAEKNRTGCQKRGTEKIAARNRRVHAEGCVAGGRRFWIRHFFVGSPSCTLACSVPQGNSAE